MHYQPLDQTRQILIKGLGRLPSHLRAHRKVPKLPGFLTCSEELRESCNSLLLRTDRKLGQAWWQELARQARKQHHRFKEEDRARMALETLVDRRNSKRLLWLMLEKSA
ncbi:hypothetical protein HOLleu_04108 [Holothuria leucospilota]|uniref:Uncharacterized protein n=1 Tax=Holothuria leucospilota TaxID=206669 RepID=A0A9Q1CU92_HOLLE|nr:hypothetical protein HOLleu_04108 [Holothuria leucospilota]